MRPQIPPQRHQPEIRNVAIVEGEHMARAVVRVEPDRTWCARPCARPPDREAEFRPVPPLFHGLDDLGVGDVELADAPERVAHDGPLGCKLGVVRQVLQLAAAAPVLRVVRTRRRDARRPGLEDLGDLPPREPLVDLERASLPPPLPPPTPPPPPPHPLPRPRTRHQHRAALREPPDPPPPRRESR